MLLPFRVKGRLAARAPPMATSISTAVASLVHGAPTWFERRTTLKQWLIVGLMASFCKTIY
jgi:hypothetical protein